MLRYFFLHRAAPWGCPREFVPKLLPVKTQCRSVRRRSGIALLKIYFPLSMRKAQRRAFPIVF